MDSIERTVDLPIAEVDAQIRPALAQQGFGVLTEIDVAATLKAKIDVDRAPTGHPWAPATRTWPIALSSWTSR